MNRTHFGIEQSACGRGSRLSSNVFRVDCRACGKKPAYVEAMATANAEKMERFLAQEPRKMQEPWRAGNMTCSACGHDEFREADRTCYGHYSNHVCASCGHNESRLTETGMSF